MYSFCSSNTHEFFIKQNINFKCLSVTKATWTYYSLVKVDYCVYGTSIVWSMFITTEDVHSIPTKLRQCAFHRTFCDKVCYAAGRNFSPIIDQISSVVAFVFLFSYYIYVSAMKRAVDVTNDQFKLWVNRTATNTNHRQRKTFFDIRKYLNEKMDDLILEKPDVSYF